ncbi:MAG: hypothetical protein EKK37_07065 [Sphingobacteriales bacterium]|nr:MAG: hypothetical protein EKK37_07065 [Sphingobacteriales bacterium]
MKFLTSFLAAVLFTVAVSAQTVDEIIGKHIDAIGGKDKIAQLKSVSQESTTEIMGNSTTVKEILVIGQGYKTETEFNGSKIISCLTDKGGWMINPMAGGANAQAMPDEAYQNSKSVIYFEGGLTDYAAKGLKAELQGTEEGSYKIKISGGVEVFYFIDTKSFNLVKVIAKGEMMGQQIDITTTFSDFKKTDLGVVLPYTKDINMGMFQMTQKTSKLEVNKDIDPKTFEMPK